MYFPVGPVIPGLNNPYTTPRHRYTLQSTNDKQNNSRHVWDNSSVPSGKRAQHNHSSPGASTAFGPAHHVNVQKLSTSFSF